MITEQRLKAAHTYVKTVTDLSRYVEDMKRLELTRCEFIVKDGIAIYFDECGQRIINEPLYELLRVAAQSSVPRLQLAITLHQLGQTDFVLFCRKAADAGVDNIVIDTNKMLFVFYDMAGNRMITEPIP